MFDMGLDIKRFFGKEEEDDYVEVDLNAIEDHQEDSKVKVRPFTLKSFDDIQEILNSMRDGYTIAVIDIKPLKTKDLIELKRAVSKVKKTVDALEGSIAGFGDNIIIATPKFAEIHRTPQPPKQPSSDKMELL